MARGKNALAAANRRAHLNNGVMAELKAENQELKQNLIAARQAIEVQRIRHNAQVLDLAEQQALSLVQAAEEKSKDLMVAAEEFVGKRIAGAYSLISAVSGSLPIVRSDANFQRFIESFSEYARDDFVRFMQEIAESPNWKTRKNRRHHARNAAAQAEFNRQARSFDSDYGDMRRKVAKVLGVHEQ